MNKLILISFSFKRGGAAMAANNFLILTKSIPNLQVSCVSQDRVGIFQFLKQTISWGLAKFQMDGNPTKHSLNLFSYALVKRVFRKEPDAIFHLHWINNDTLSIGDFRLIPPGSILTLHDEWLYCGAEHYYKSDDSNLDFVTGYQLKKAGLRGFHWNYYRWKKKYAQLTDRKDLIFTVPSRWMLDRAKKSLILKNSTLVVLPNCIDTATFAAAELEERQSFRDSLGLVQDDVVILFGAIDGGKNQLKGAHLLRDALSLLAEAMPEFEKKRVKFLNFGGNATGSESTNGFPVTSLGHISDKAKLALVYSSSDFVVVPSVIESFGQVAAEALACESPVVCFRNSGLLDIVEKDKSGLFAEPYLVSSLADQILKLIRMSRSQRREMGSAGRNHIVKNFSPKVISEKYQEVLHTALAVKKSSVR